MRINSISFTGYDARHLRGFFMSADCNGLAREMQAIGDSEGFDIYSSHLEDDGYHCKKTLPVFQTHTMGNWAQDMWMFVKDKLLTSEHDDCESDSIKDFFNLKYDKTEVDTFKRIVFSYDDEDDEIDDESEKFHIQGGNIYIVKGDNGDEAIVGSDIRKYFSIDDIKSMYSVDRVTVLPQMDYHLDLFIRPLDDKRILLADDEMSLKLFKQGMNKLMDYVKKNPDLSEEYFDIADRFVSVLSNFENSIKENKNAESIQVEKILRKKGFEVIRVPGRVYRVSNDLDTKDCGLTNYCNYMNANVLKNKNGELVYITNDSIIDDMLGLTPEISKKIGFSFQDSFVDAISPYIDREHIYFVRGDNNFVKNEMLMCYLGGIHCSCSEIPE